MNIEDLIRDLNPAPTDTVPGPQSLEARTILADVTSDQSQHPGWRRRKGWAHRAIVVAVAAAILVVFFVPLPQLNLFKRLVNPAKTLTPTGVTTTPRIWKQIAELKAPDAEAGDYFGGGKASETLTTPLEEAVSGNTVVVGEPYYGNQTGRVYVFARTGSGWMQTAAFEGSDSAPVDDFGSAVAISDNTIVVGAPYHPNQVGGAYTGRAYVFTRSASGWKQTAELQGSDTVAAAYFGASVAIAGATVMVGAPAQSNGAGRVYVFTKTAAGWKQIAELTGSDTVNTNDQFGYSVAMSGTTAVVSAPNNSNDAGRAYLFTETASGWKQMVEIKGSDTVAGDSFGGSVAISGGTLVVGAASHANGAGRAYVFTRTGTEWKQVAELKGSDTVAGENFGWSVAVSGTIAIVGAPSRANQAGRAYVFTKTATAWKQTAELKGSDTVAGDSFGQSLAVSGKTAVVGAPVHSYTTGRAYVFQG